VPSFIGACNYRRNQSTLRKSRVCGGSIHGVAFLSISYDVFILEALSSGRKTEDKF
jgi:hypothetical protein